MRSPRDSPGTPPLTSTVKVVLAEIGEKVPYNHLHPGKERRALWRGSDVGGHGTGDGWKEEIFARLPTDRVLRASTVPG